MQRTTRPIVFGEPYSVYVRTVRLALEEKAVNYELVPVDVFASFPPVVAGVAVFPMPDAITVRYLLVRHRRGP